MSLYTRVEMIGEENRPGSRARPSVP